MYMVTMLVPNKKYNFPRTVFHYMKDNITSGSRSWVYPRFVQMMLDHAYPNLKKDEENDLMMLHHMDNEKLIRLSKYTKNWPEPKKTEFFEFIKSDKYEDPDPVNHLKWRNDAEMQDQNQEQLTPETEQLLKDIVDTLEAGKLASKTVVDDGKESSSGSEVDIDAQVERWIKEKYDPKYKEKQKKRKRSSNDDDETFVPQENVQVVKSPSSGCRKKSTSRKCVGTPAARKLKFKLKINPPREPQSKPPSPPQNIPVSPSPRQPSPDPLQSPQSIPQHHISSPIHKQPPITPPHVLQTPPTTQPPVHTTPGSSVFENSPHIPESTVLEELNDFSFVNDDL
ncbi:hypothetical protein Hanom_Chr08g00720881 [Helianthus anomalus]